MITKPQNTTLSDEADNDQYDCMCRQEQQYMADDYLTCTPLVDEECRRRMIAWFYQVVDFCNFDRETVEISINFLDRFLSSNAVSGELTRNDFQLIAMTCLYVAIKIHEPVAVEPKTVAGLSGGQFTANDIEACERKLLAGLSWRMNPPTTMSFVRVQLRDMSLSLQEEREVQQLTKMQLEEAVRDYSIMTRIVPSVLAEAALWNSMRLIACHGNKHLAVNMKVAGLLARSLPIPLPSASTQTPVTPKRASFVRYESNADLSPTTVAVQ